MRKGSLNKWVAATIVLTTVLCPAANPVFASTSDANQIAQPILTVKSNFSDLGQASDSLQNAILIAQQRGLMTGDPSGKFRPQDTITRQEFASVIVKALHLNMPQGVASSFTDVSSSDWGAPYIGAMHQAGLMNGDGKSFRPDAPITREEMAVVLCKALGLDVTGKGNDLSFQDKDSVDSWAKPYVQAAIEAGLLQTNGQNFNPQQVVKRQEVAVVAVQTSNTTAHVIEDVQDGSVTISGITYQIPDDLKGVFSSRNRDVLKGAKINAQFDSNTLTQVTNLELNASGQALVAGSTSNSGHLVLDGQGSTLTGNLLVNGDFVTVQNLNVAGNVTSEAGVKQQMMLNHVQVKGNTVLDGGTGAAFVMENAQLGSVVLKASGARWQAQGSTSASDLTVQANANLSAEQTLGSCKVTVEPGVSNLQVQAQFGELDVAGQARPKISLGQSAAIGNLVLPTGVTAADLFADYLSNVYLLPQINGKPNPDLPTPKPVTPPAPPLVPPAPPLVPPFAPPSAPVVNKANLDAEIGVATGMTGSASIGSAAGQVPQEAVDALNAAIIDATTVMNNAQATQQQVDAALQALQAAVTAFESSQVSNGSSLHLSIQSANKLYVGNSSFTLTSDPVPPSYSYTKQTLQNLITVTATNSSGGQDPTTLVHDSTNNDYKVEDTNNQEVGEIQLTSSNPSLLSITAGTNNGYDFTPKSGLTESTPVSVNVKLFENGQEVVAEDKQIPVTVDTTIPQVQNGNATYDSSTSDIKVKMNESFPTSPSSPTISVETSALGDFTTDTVTLANGTDYTVSQDSSDPSVLLVHLNDSVKQSVAAGSTFKITVQSITDYGGNPINTGDGSNIATVKISAF